jgi:hypothetical protein
LIRDFTVRLLNNSSKGLGQLTNKFPAVLLLAFMLGATSSWAVDVDDEDAATDAPAKTQDADAKPTALEQHVSSAPPGHAYTHSAKPTIRDHQ